MLLILFIGTSVPSVFSALDLVLPANQELTMSLLCLVPNLSVWWLVFSSIRRARDRSQKESSTSSVT